MDVVDSIKLLRLSFPPEIHPPPLFIPRRYDRSFSNTPHPPPPSYTFIFSSFLPPINCKTRLFIRYGRKFLSIRSQPEDWNRSIDRSSLPFHYNISLRFDLSYIYIYISRLQPTYYFDNRVSIIIKQSSESRNTCISQAFDCQSSIALSFYRWSRWCRFNR